MLECNFKSCFYLALKLEKKKLCESEYIPLEGILGSTRFGVVPIRNIMLARKLAKNKLAEEATNFKKENLFGNRIRRTPSKCFVGLRLLQLNQICH